MNYLEQAQTVFLRAHDVNGSTLTKDEIQVGILSAIIALVERQQSAEELRPCNFLDLEKGPSRGYFHHWNPDGLTALVEHEDGHIANVYAVRVQFLDREGKK